MGVDPGNSRKIKRISNQQGLYTTIFSCILSSIKVYFSIIVTFINIKLCIVRVYDIDFKYDL